MAHWAGCLQESIHSVRVRHNLNVKSLFLSCLYSCIESIEKGVHVVTLAIPTNILNLIANRAMRYDIDISHLLKCLANSSVSKLELTNYGVGRNLPVDFYKELSFCTNLSHLDLYGFESHSSQFCKLGFLRNLVSLSLGCDRSINILSKELINTLLCHNLTTLQLRNFIIDFKYFELFPFLTSLSLSKCVLSQSGDLVRNPPLNTVTIASPVPSFGSVHIPDFTMFTSTLQTLRLSHLPLDTDTLFRSQIFPFLTELETCFCESNQSISDVIDDVHIFCPNLCRLVFLSDTQHITNQVKHPHFQLVSHKSTPPVLMELIINHFHNPEAAFAIANAKPTENTYYWAKGRMANRAAVSPHFLILANLLYLNPTYKHAPAIVNKLWVRMDLWDKDIICGEDYLVPLVYYYWHGKGDKDMVRQHIGVAWDSNCIDTKRREALVAGIVSRYK